MGKSWLCILIVTTYIAFYRPLFLSHLLSRYMHLLLYAPFNLQPRKVLTEWRPFVLSRYS